jgi:hypothetical protein
VGSIATQAVLLARAEARRKFAALLLQLADALWAEVDGEALAERAATLELEAIRLEYLAARLA